MEFSGHSSNNLSDFEFKYIPKSQFERVLREVESKRRSRRNKLGMWGDFCTVTSELENADFIKKNVKFMDDGSDGDSNDIKNNCTLKPSHDDFELVSVLDHQTIKSNRLILPSAAAPLFGPPRKYTSNSSKSVKKHERPSAVPPQQTKYTKITQKKSSSQNSSIHIVEEVNVADTLNHHRVFDEKIQVAAQITSNEDVNDVKSSSIECSSDNDEELYSEMLDLCDEIENTNDVGSGMTHRNEMKIHSRSVVDKIKADDDDDKRKLDRYIEEQRDSLDDQTLYVGEEEKQEAREEVDALMSQPGGRLRTEFFYTKSRRNESPMMKNQMSKCERYERRSNGKSSVKIERKENLTRRDVNANIKSNNVTEKSAERPKSDESLASLRSLMAIHRMAEYQEKMCQYLGHIHEIIENPPEVDGINDLNKRKKRETEFTNRFARNHLYQIGRAAEELRIMPDNPMDLVVKVNSLFHLMMQAVQTYLKNVEMFIVNKNPDKLLVLVDFIINASKICFDRKILDKRNTSTMKLLRKCAELREDLSIKNHDDDFYEKRKKKKENVHGRSEFSHGKKPILQKKLKNSLTIVENPKAHNMQRHQRGSLKYSYDFANHIHEHPNRDHDELPETYAEPRRKTKANLPKNHLITSKSPYDSPLNPYANPAFKQKSKPKKIHQNLLPSRNTIYGQSRNSVVRQASQQILRKIPSDVSTVMQKEMEKENQVNNKQTDYEKPLENVDANEIMKMIQSITKEKFEEMLAPMLTQFLPKYETENSKASEEMKSSGCRVTADIEPLKKSMEVGKNVESNETIERIAHNIQYTFIKSLHDDEQEDEKVKVPKATELQTPLEPPSTSKTPEKIVMGITEKPPIDACNIDSGADDGDFDFKSYETRELQQMAMKARIEIIENMSESPFYRNEKIDQPWKMFSRISDKILNDMIGSVLKELECDDFEVAKDFVNCEFAY